jgi:hypothetical protein
MKVKISQKYEIPASLVSALLGFYFAYPAYGLFGPNIEDGPCSGVWGPIQIHCFIPDAIYSTLSVLLPILIFTNRTKVAFSTALSFLIICVAWGLANHNILMFFRRQLYVPSIFGVWIGIWAVVISAIGVILFGRFCSKSKHPAL